MGLALCFPRRVEMMKKTLAVIFLVLLVGCVTGKLEVRQEDLPLGKKLTYIIPKNEGMETDGFLRGLHFRGTKQLFPKYPHVPDSNIFIVSGIDIQYDSQRNLIFCTEYNGNRFLPKYRGETETEYSSFVRYSVLVDTKESDDNYTITLEPTHREISTNSRYDVPNFSEAKLLDFLSEATVRFRVEIDSPYNTESTYANFKRLLAEDVLKEPQVDKVTGKIYKSAFYFPQHRKRARLLLDVFPYRNGSKAVISVEMSVSVEPNTKTANIPNDILNMRTELARIVGS
jgi:hypothetical protein